MADFVAKLQELEEYIVDEFDALKSYYGEAYEIDPKNLDTLLYKIKYQINEIVSQENDPNKEIKCHNSDILIKSQTIMSLQDLTGKIINEFEALKNCNYSAYQFDANNLDSVLFKVKFHIDEMKNYILSRRNDGDSKEVRDIEIRKANALIKMQTLANLITCRIINLNNSS